MILIDKLIKFRDKKAVIFGSSHEGRVVYEILKICNISAYCFLDNNPKKINTSLGSIQILHPEKILDMEDYIIIIPDIYYNSMYKQLMDLNICPKNINHIDIYNFEYLLYDAPYRLRLYIFLNKYFKGLSV